MSFDDAAYLQVGLDDAADSKFWMMMTWAFYWVFMKLVIMYWFFRTMITGVTVEEVL